MCQIRIRFKMKQRHLTFIIVFALLILKVAGLVPSFTIDAENNTFVRNGQPHRYVSGSIHYVRVLPGSWKDRLQKIRLGGANTIQTYVEWSSHEPQPGNYKFSGNLDIVSFISTAQDLGLDVILRPGPFIDAERDFGGLPSWLLKNNDIKLRTNDKYYMERVSKWFTKLFAVIKPLLFKNGGPISMIQIENEYGSYALQTGHKDIQYLTTLRDLVRKLVGDDVVLFTTDGAGSDYLINGVIPGVFPTVDFGCSGDSEAAFKVQRQFLAVGGPLVNSEFYPGWLDHWQRPHSRVDTGCVVNTLDKMLSQGANVNIYMFFGGTSFGFSAGSNSNPFQPIPTSYDYDAPITEAGDLTQKFWSIRETIGRYLPLEPIPDSLQNVTAKGKYGKVKLEFVSTIFDSLSSLSRSSNDSKYPLNFESLDQSYGFMLYDTTIVGLKTDPVLLKIPGLRDRGTVFVDHKPVGILSRTEEIFSLPIQVLPGQQLSVLVENQGRICYGPDLADRKGILGNVSLGVEVITGWRMTGLPLDDGYQMTRYAKKILDTTRTDLAFKKHLRDGGMLTEGKMTFWHGEFQTGNSVVAQDTFLSLSGWHKGVVWINGFNVGRYWPTVGPQRTLYIPGHLLRSQPASNDILLLEQVLILNPETKHNVQLYYSQEHGPCITGGECTVELVDTPDIDGDTPYSMF